MPVDSLMGRRILVVEDETVLATLIEDALESLGCIIVGPAARLDVALQLATDEVLDAAVLDVTIRGGKVYPVAERLLARKIPFVLASGYGEWAIPHFLRDAPLLTTPFSPDELEARVRELCGGGTGAPLAAA
jgi:DNA-binding response OmpR family regulator